MIFTFYFLSLVLLAYYVFLLIYSIRGWTSSKPMNDSASAVCGISVIIPFRNEKENLESLIQSLKNQDYNNKCYEVIFINDHSSDNGQAELEKLLKDVEFKYKMISLPSLAVGKKTALSFGIKESTYENILTTDADAHHGVKWLSSIALHLNKNKTSFHIIPVQMSGASSIFQKFQELDFLALQFITRSFAGNDNAILCNGSNLSFQKSLFEKLNGFSGNEHIPSGDDFFLLMKMRKHNRKGIKYIANMEASVRVDPERSLFHFLSQRLRWSSKSKYAGSSWLISIGLLNTLISFWLVISPFVELHLFKNLNISMALISLKFIGDYGMLKMASSFFNVKFSFIEFGISFILYPIYICLIFILSFIYKPTWKERKLR